MPGTDTNDESVALAALGWTVGEPARAGRLLALTGLTPADLRASAGTPATLAAVLGFLANHEHDLVDCARAIAVPPAELAAVRERLERA